MEGRRDTGNIHVKTSHMPIFIGGNRKRLDDGLRVERKNLSREPVYP